MTTDHTRPEGFRIPLLVCAGTILILTGFWLVARWGVRADLRAYDNNGRTRAFVHNVEVETKLRGEQIVAAIERYAAARAAYPPRLRHLVPAYIDALHPPLCGPEGWFYRVADDGKSFELVFGTDVQYSRYSTRPYPGWSWDQASRTWHLAH